MKKKIIALGLLALCGTATLTSCENAVDPVKSNAQTESENVELKAKLQGIYALYEANGGTQTYEEWLDSIKGKDGTDGVSITSIEKTKSEDNVDVYTITLSNGNTSTFNVVNGKDGIDGKDGVNGRDGIDGKDGLNGRDGIDGKDGLNGKDGIDGVSITSIEKTSSEGNVDTYTITFSNGNTFEYTVTNGTDGAKGEKGETGKDGKDGAKGDTAYASTLVPSVNGYVIPSKGSAVIGTEYTFNVKPANGYFLSKLLINGEDVTESVNYVDNTYTTTMVEGGFVVEAYFEQGVALVEGNLDSVLKTINSSEKDLYVRVMEDIDYAKAQNLVFENANNTIVDFAGHKLTVSVAQALNLSSKGSLEFRNGSLELAKSNNSKNFINTHNGSFTFDNMNITTVANAFTYAAIFVYGDSTKCVVKNSNVNTNSYYSVSTNNLEGSKLKIELDNSTFVTQTSDFDNSTVMINVENSVTSIKNCNITGDRHGVIARLGEFVIEDSTITTTGKWLDKEANKNTNEKYLSTSWSTGNEVPSAALVVGDKNKAYGSSNEIDTKVTVKNVVCNSSNGALDTIVSEDNNTKTVFVYDEATYKDIKGNFVASYDLYKDSVSSAVSRFSDLKADTCYIILKEDIDNAPGFKTQAGQNVVFDLNKHTYATGNPTVGSKGTETNGFQFLKGSKVTIKNGTLSLSNESIKLGLQNYSDLTLDNVVVDASLNANCSYAVSNNFGSLTLKESTIKAAEGQKAFDLWYGMSQVYDDGVTVYVDSKSKIYGDIEYGASSRVTDTSFTEKTILTVQKGALQNDSSEFVVSKSSHQKDSEDKEFTINIIYVD
ncbi:MAG: hypothetical protein K6G28_00880 [Acholeplasmatales bacterium]|nr:hypothetical protein [Acholeplasmatales bacterium]